MKRCVLLACIMILPLVAGCATEIVQPDSDAEVVLAPAPVEIAEQAVGQPEESRKIILGWVERVQIGNMEYKPKAKLDSGAQTSSIDAEIIRQFERDGQEHIVFRVKLGDDEDSAQVMEAPIKRWVRIRRKGSEEEYIRRPVVEMNFCLGGQNIVGEVNLAERGNFIYPVLIGRNMLVDNILVDTSKTFVMQPACG